MVEYSISVSHNMGDIRVTLGGSWPLSRKRKHPGFISSRCFEGSQLSPNSNVFSMCTVEDSLQYPIFFFFFWVHIFVSLCLLCLSVCHAQAPPEHDTGWNGDLWLKNFLLKKTFFFCSTSNLKNNITEKSLLYLFNVLVYIIVKNFFGVHLNVLEYLEFFDFF